MKKIIFAISLILSIIILYKTNIKYDSYYKDVISDVEIYIDKNGDEAPIPNGFILSEENNIISEGLVIIDNSNKETHGNEFTWIPCTSFKRTQFHKSETPFSNYNMDFVDEKEYQAIIDSVKKYKGFYIAKYESSKSNKYIDNIQIAASVKGQFPWVEIPYSATMNDIYGYSYGMLKVSKYTYKLFENINSTLMYPEHFDSIINWYLSFDNLKSDYGTKITKEDILGESKQIGNYNNALYETGSKQRYCIKNVCDLAGNAREMTTENYLGNYHIYRGGAYFKNNSMTERNIMDAYYPTTNIGFRIVLII